MVKIKKKKRKGEAFINDKPGLAQAMHDARARMGITQRNLSVEANCSSHLVSEIERKNRESLLVEDLKRISDVLNCNLLSFIGIERYTLKTKEKWTYKIGQTIRLSDGSTCEVVSVLSRSIVVLDKKGDRRVLGKGETELV